MYYNDLHSTRVQVNKCMYQTECGDKTLHHFSSCTSMLVHDESTPNIQEKLKYLIITVIKFD